MEIVYCVMCSYEAGKPTELVGEKFKLTGEDLKKAIFGDSFDFVEFKGEGFVCKKHAIEVQMVKMRLLDAEIRDYERQIDRCRKEIGQLATEKARIEAL